jgi:DMSO/TMAO reductase YedYZ heme-binding membrane subunit
VQYVYYTIAAIVLYFVSDWMLGKIEQARGKRFAEQRSLVFLIIIMVLAVSSFKLIELLVNS